ERGISQPRAVRAGRCLSSASVVFSASSPSLGVLCQPSRPCCTLVLMATVNVNGRISDQEHAVVPVFDHGFLYGEGVYETLRTYNGQPFLFDRHMRRLRKSADMLVLTVPLSDAEIDARFRETIAAAGLGGSAHREAYIRILVTRGIGELTYDPAA